MQPCREPTGVRLQHTKTNIRSTRPVSPGSSFAAIPNSSASINVSRVLSIEVP